MANRKLGILGNLRNLGNVISGFRFCPTTAKIENTDLKNSEKSFQNSRVFDLASVFNIQESLHSNKIMPQILKEAFSRKHTTLC